MASILTERQNLSNGFESGSGLSSLSSTQPLTTKILSAAASTLNDTVIKVFNSSHTLESLDYLDRSADPSSSESELGSLGLSTTASSNMNNDVVFKPIGEPTLKKIHDILIVLLLICVMFAMGTAITWRQVWSHLRRPFGVVIGMLSQFFLLPFAAFILIHALGLNVMHATGMLVLACSPGGVTSNVFAFFCDGDLSLSVTMTTISTVVALVMMPFNLWLYGRSLETDALVIPYSRMSLSLFFLTVPVVFGMIVNWKAPRLSPYLTKIGSISGFAIIIICQTLEVFIFPDIFKDVPANLYAAELILPFLGLSLGYVAASVFRLDFPVRRTIAIEAGIQNVGTALTIISLSFPFEQLRQVWLFPFLYAFSMLGVCICVASMFQIHKRFFSGKSFNVSSEDLKSFPAITTGDQAQRLTGHHHMSEMNGHQIVSVAMLPPQTPSPTPSTPPSQRQ